MPLFRQRRQPQVSPEDELARLLGETVSVIEGLKAENFRDEHGQALCDKSVELGVGWTALSTSGFFVEVSEPYSKAFARLVFGLKENKGDDIQGAVADMIAVAQKFSGT